MIATLKRELIGQLGVVWPVMIVAVLADTQCMLPSKIKMYQLFASNAINVVGNVARAWRRWSML
jgi:hypothetical protein